MKLRSLRPFALALIVAAANWPGTVSAQAPTVIDHLPYTITTSGLYVLNSNLNGGPNNPTLIQISANNVTIDFQGHFIAGPVSGNNGQTVYGIAAGEKSNLTIKNGTIAYCTEAINLYGNGTENSNSVNHVIDNMRVTYCSMLGINVFYCPGTRITNCQFSKIGTSNILGIRVIDITGPGVLVANNVISSIIGVDSGRIGISLTAGDFARQNTISDSYYGVTGGKYQDNLTANCTVPVSDGIDAGGNN